MRISAAESQQEYSSDSPTFDHELIQNLQSVIETRYTEPDFGVPDLLEIAQISRAQLTRKFRTLLGCSPGKCIQNIRMKHAIRLLRQTTEPVKNVAWMCGYKTYPGFWRAFKMHFGQRPTAITRPAGYSIPLVLMDWKMPPSENLKNQLLLAFRDSPWLLRFFRLMLERFDEDRFTLKDLAFELDSSPPQVIRKLNEFLGISPMRLRQHLRLLFAAELLNDSTKSITEVAHTVGFHDQAHLCKSFKAVFGLTPSAYRQNSKVQYELSWLRDPVSGKW